MGRPSATDEFLGLAIAMVRDRRPDLVDDYTGELRGGPYVDAVIRGLARRLADAHRARVAA